jgi:hypothetical protein
MHHVVHEWLRSFDAPVPPLLSSLIPAPLVSSQTLRHEFSAFYQTQDTREDTLRRGFFGPQPMSHIIVMSTFPALLGYC